MSDESSDVVLKVLIISERPYSKRRPDRIPGSQLLKEQLTKDFKEREERFIFETVTVCETPQAALDRLKEFMPDFVIIDFSSLDLVNLETLVEELQASFYKPKEILIINMEPGYHKEFLCSDLGWSLYLAYFFKGPRMYSALVESLGYLWIRRYRYIT